jgi:hypothetical protein
MNERGCYGNQSRQLYVNGAYGTPVLGIEPETKRILGRTAVDFAFLALFMGVGAYLGSRASTSEATKGSSMIIGGAAGWFAHNAMEQTSLLRSIARAQFR